MRWVAWKAAVCLAWLAASATGHAADTAAAGGEALACYSIGRVVDPDLAPDAVAVEMAVLTAAAEGGSDQAAYVLGTLHRLGPEHPAQRLPQDPVLADQWLRKAALAGNLFAMSGLAENELARGRARESLVLALARIHYGKNHPDPAFRKIATYQADLVRRGFEALGEPRTEHLEAALLDEVQAFVDAHGEGIVAGLFRWQEPQVPSGCAGEVDQARWPLEMRGVSSVLLRTGSEAEAPPRFVLFHLVVKPNGRVERALPVDFAPDAGLMPRTRRAAEGMIFNKLEDAPLRTGLLPLLMQ